MRRVSVFALAVLLIGSLSGSAEAGSSIKVRLDPDDTGRGAINIRAVSSDLSATEMYLAVQTWGRLDHQTSYFQIYLDTHGTARFDRLVEITYASVQGQGRGWFCFGTGFDGTSPPGNPAIKKATRTSATSVACRLPRSWFPGIHRAVRFVVESGGTGFGADRAPDHGRYIWV